MISSLFKPPKHKRFDYSPRYYDEIKEDISVRKKQIHKNIERQKEPSLDQISLTRGVFQQKHKKKSGIINRQSLLIVIALSGVLGFIYYEKYIFLAVAIIPFILRKRFLSN